MFNIYVLWILKNKHQPTLDLDIKACPALFPSYLMLQFYLIVWWISYYTNAVIIRGETGGRSGIFPAAFVRIIDSFPGDVPGPGADPSSYLRADLSSGHEYDNTR